MPKNLNGTGDVSSTSPEIEALDVENQNAADTQKADGHEEALESSTNADGKESVSEKDWDPLSVVKKAVGKDQEDSDATDEGQGKQADKSSKSENDSQKAGGEQEELGEVTDEELKSYKPKTRKRIEGLLDDRQRLTERVTTLEPAAEQMETLQTFMQERQLTPQNVSELLVVGGLAMSTDPKDLRSALTRIEQFATQIKSQLGDVLPEDLQKKVEDGLLDAETAKEVALSRVETQHAKNKAEKADTTVKTVADDAQTERNELAAEVVKTTISDWQRQKFSSDPDYPRKAELLQKEIRLRVIAEGGQVLDKTKALKIAEEAYTEVNRLFKSLTPSNNLPAKRVVQSRSNPGNMASTPNSALDAARAGLAKTAG